MITIGICDDNEIELMILNNFIVKYFDEKQLDYHIHSFKSGKELLSFYEKHNLDLLLLDIYMDDINGIESGKSIRSLDSKVEIIFCTASSSHALESYDMLAFGYLVKPFDANKLKQLLEKFIESRPHTEHKHLVVKSNYSDRVIDYHEIVYIESDDKVLSIYLISGETVKTYGKLNEIESQLNSTKFLRCHQSYIINMEHVKNIVEEDFLTVTDFLVPIRKRESRKIRDMYLGYKKNQ